MSGFSDENPRENLGHEQLIIALLAKTTITAAAKQVGISEATAHRWMKDPVFKDAYREARRESVTHAISILQRATNAAVTAILRNLKDDVQPAIQLRAAELVLKYATEGVTNDDLLARINEIEERIGKTMPTNHGRQGSRYA